MIVIEALYLSGISKLVKVMQQLGNRKGGNQYGFIQSRGQKLPVCVFLFFCLSVSGLQQETHLAH